VRRGEFLPLSTLPSPSPSPSPSSGGQDPTAEGCDAGVDVGLGVGGMISMSSLFHRTGNMNACMRQDFVRFCLLQFPTRREVSMR
jgi:hypothetical protein